ncbi:hypothetical protein ACJIZ3_003759 [Penstemon smallii]|uniref:glucan endo-1,3-beta-D-glucosidase n=1 Tax=Penstemon smallii TaxID=265156 RepID=A0ABD3S039_9LAMI
MANAAAAAMSMSMSMSMSSLLVLLFLAGGVVSALGLGINYGQVANNLPHPQSVVPLVKSIGATRVKLYDADPAVLKAFSNTGVEFIVGIGNECLSKMCDPNQALSWVKSNVLCYLPSTKITTIAVGNEVLTYNDTTLSSNLLPAMQNIQTALISLNLHNQVSVTTAHNFGILQLSYPPSAGTFRRELTQTLSCILDFHSKFGSPFLINAYPYFAYKTNNNISNKQLLDFALFQGDGIVDPQSGLHYDGMFHAQIDAAYTAIGKLGYKNVCLQVSETGWPSKGDADEPGASPEYARKYNANVLKLISQKKGTPMRPNLDLNVYIFALFNENQKPGPTSERNFGLFKPDGSPVYDLGFKVTGGLGSSSSTNNTSGSNGGGAITMPPAVGSSDGYLSINDAVRLPSQRAVSFLWLMVWVILAFHFAVAYN